MILKISFPFLYLKFDSCKTQIIIFWPYPTEHSDLRTKCTLEEMCIISYNYALLGLREETIPRDNLEMIVFFYFYMPLNHAYH